MPARGLYLFVGVIFVVGLMLAGYYTFFKAPGESKMPQRLKSSIQTHDE